VDRYKTGHIPFQQAQPERHEEQEKLKEQQLEPRLAEMIAGQREVFFGDGLILKPNDSPGRSHKHQWV